MTGRSFVDTNVLIYAATARNDEPEKHRLANAILQNETFSVSAQVLQEFFVVSQKKPQQPFTAAQAAEWVGWLAPFCDVANDSCLVQRAIETAAQHRLSYWDGAILAAAERIKAPILYSEDLNHGQRYGSVQVINPFRR